MLIQIYIPKSKVESEDFEEWLDHLEYNSEQNGTPVQTFESDTEYRIDADAKDQVIATVMLMVAGILTAKFGNIKIKIDGKEV